MSARIDRDEIRNMYYNWIPLKDWWVVGRTYSQSHLRKVMKEWDKRLSSSANES